MYDLHLTTEPVGADALTAGYSCPCGCTLAKTYRSGDRVAKESCCCGNEFAVGPDAAAHVPAPLGYTVQQQTLGTPWGEQLPVAWAIGPSTHAEQHHGTQAPQPEGLEHAPAIDPVCGMTVDPVASRASDLYSHFDGADYFFCGRGCKLEFDDEPGRYLDPSFVPSM